MHLPSDAPTAQTRPSAFVTMLLRICMWMMNLMLWVCLLFCLSVVIAVLTLLVCRKLVNNSLSGKSHDVRPLQEAKDYQVDD